MSPDIPKQPDEESQARIIDLTKSEPYIEIPETDPALQGIQAPPDISSIPKIEAAVAKERAPHNSFMQKVKNLGQKVVKELLEGGAGFGAR